MKIPSRILFIEIVNTLKNTKKSPNQPKIIAIDNKLEPRSRCSKFCIYFSELNKFNFTYIKLSIRDENGLDLGLFKIIVTCMFNSNDL